MSNVKSETVRKREARCETQDVNISLVPKLASLSWGCLKSSETLSLRALFSEAISNFELKSGDCFGTKRLAMTLAGRFRQPRTITANESNNYV